MQPSSLDQSAAVSWVCRGTTREDKVFLICGTVTSQVDTDISHDDIRRRQFCIGTGRPGRNRKMICGFTPYYAPFRTPSSHC